MPVQTPPDLAMVETLTKVLSSTIMRRIRLFRMERHHLARFFPRRRRAIRRSGFRPNPLGSSLHRITPAMVSSHARIPPEQPSADHPSPLLCASTVAPFSPISPMPSRPVDIKSENADRPLPAIHLFMGPRRTSVKPKTYPINLTTATSDLAKVPQVSRLVLSGLFHRFNLTT
jgi:hypothetical protein